MTTNRDLVSVIIPAHNGERYLRDAIDSALAQSHERLEIIVVDDGSTDGTRADVDAWASAGPLPIRVFTQANSGKHVALNHGIREARGDYTLIVDSDDRCPSNAVDAVKKAVQSAGGYVARARCGSGVLEALEHFGVLIRG